jgi:substrate import-associated zinc metallohydrolase lipoprotein
MLNSRRSSEAKVIPLKTCAYRRGAFEACHDRFYGPSSPTMTLLARILRKLGLNFRRTGVLLKRHRGKLPILLLLCCMISCKKDDNLGDLSNIPGLGGDSSATTAIDQWINDTLTVPFNVEAKYRWDQNELDLNKDLTPPMESKIIPVLSAVKKVWIDTYVAEAGSDFMKRLIPKFFILVGSASWNTDGTITLGSAEGGHQIILYVLNDFYTKGMPGYVPADSVKIVQMFHTIEHEFGHILHQTVLYPTDFKTITVGLYTANWNNVTDAEAQRDGFVTAYARSAPDEDFVEMIATMLTLGKDGFDNLVNNIPTGTSVDGKSQEQAVSALRQKQQIVVDYFKNTWSIDFYSLQMRVRSAVVSLIQ